MQAGNEDFKNSPKRGVMTNDEKGSRLALAFVIRHSDFVITPYGIFTPRTSYLKSFVTTIPGVL